MERLAAIVYRRRRAILGAWLAVLAASLAFIAVVGDELTPRQELPGSESVRIGERLADEFGIPQAEPIQVVLRSGRPLADDRAAVDGLVDELRRTFPGRRIDSPFASETGTSAIGPSGLVGYVNVPFDDQLAAQNAVPEAQRAVADADVPFTAIVSGGPAIALEMTPALNEDLARAEVVAGGLSLLVLVGVLGTVVAGAVPLVLALFVLPAVLAIVFGISHLTDVTVFAPNVVTLVGLGIAVDYSLLVVYRFREELAARDDVAAAVAATMHTAVRSVIFSGATVAIGLGVLLLVPVPFVRSFGLAGILIPAVTIAAALTLLPALMAVLGRRIDRFRVVPRAWLASPESPFWRRVANVIMRAPGLWLAVGLAIVLAIAAPVRDLTLGSTPFSTFPDTGPASEGLRIVLAEFGDGGAAPVRVLVDAPAAVAEAAVPAIEAAPGVTRVAVVPGERSTLIDVLGTGEVGSAAANDLVARLRADVLPAALGDVPFGVGGGPAVFYDFQQALYGDFGWIALLVVLVTGAVLFRAFRSALLPLKAVAMNVLSVAGAYGLLVLVFQKGAGADLLDFHTTPQIAVWIPLFLFAFLFGLSMDYEVFLLSRMREEYDRDGDNASAVAGGLAKTGKLITSAAMIMVIAFGGLAASRFAEMQQFGFGLAAAILLDATLIRALIVPSLMVLMGRWNWWLPRPLARLAGAAAARRPSP